MTTVHPLLVLAAFALAGFALFVLVLSVLHVVSPDPVRKGDIQDVHDGRGHAPPPPASWAPLPPWTPSGGIVEHVPDAPRRQHQ